MIVETINLEPQDIQALDAGEVVIISLAKRMMDISIKKITISEEIDIEEGKKTPVFIPDKKVKNDSRRGNKKKPEVGREMGMKE